MSNFDVLNFQRGNAMIAVILAAAILLLAGAGIMRGIHSETVLIKNHEELVVAYYLAEAGVHRALSLLQKNPDFGADGSWKSFSLGDGIYRLQLAFESQDRVKIRSRGAYKEAQVELSAAALIIWLSEPETSEVQVFLVDFKGIALP